MMRRRLIKRTLSIVLCICMLAGLVMGSGGISVLATSLNVGTRYPDQLVQKTNTNEDQGDSSNPYTILEIVPSYEEAQLGYFIPGCEPVDMVKAQYDINVMGNFTSTFADVYDISIQKVYAFYDEIISADQNEYLSVYDNNLGTTYHSREDLNYSTTWLNYGQWRTTSGDYSEKGDYTKVGSGNGNFSYEPRDSWNPNSVKVYKYVGEGNGEYIWEASDNGSVTRTANGDLFYYEYIQYKHKDTFVKNVFAYMDDTISSDTFQAQVITLTPADLESNLDLIDTADMIAIHPGSGDYKGIAQIYYALNKNGDTGSPASSAPTFWDEGCDLTYNEVMRITARMASDEPAALIMDKANMFASNKAQMEYNVHKLLYMTLMYKPSYFWSTFQSYLSGYIGADGYEKVMYTDGNGKQYKFWWIDDSVSYTYTDTSGNERTASTQNMFLFNPETGESMLDEVRYLNINSGGYDIFDNILTYHGDTSMVQTLLSGGNIQKHNMQIDGIFANNITSDAFVNGAGDSLTNLAAVTFIVKKWSAQINLHILEIEPCSKFIYDNSSEETIKYWKQYYRSLLSWYNPKSSYSDWMDDPSLIQIDTMTTAEFIGSVGTYDYDGGTTLTTDSSDDLTARYDMIVFGSMQDETNGLYGYNDSSLNNTGSLSGLIYTAVGDLVVPESNAKSSVVEAQNDSRYSGNDITLKKLLELEDFMKAGNPIVIDEGLFVFGESDSYMVDTSKVDSSSKFYQLLQCGDENLLIHSHIKSSAMKKLLKTEKCKLIFADTNSYPTEYSYTTDENGAIDEETGLAAGTRKLTYKFKISGEEDKDYVATLNLDMDGDGVYSGSLKERAEIVNMNLAMGYATEDDYEQDSIQGWVLKDGIELSEDAYAFEETESAHGLSITTMDGSAVTGTLTANTWYYASYTIPSTKFGVIPWKFEVHQTDNIYARSSAVDYTLVPITTDKTKIGLNVLQMNLRSDMKSEGLLTSRWAENKYISTIFTYDVINVEEGEVYDSETDYTSSKKNRTDNVLKSSLSAEQISNVERFETFLDAVPEFNVNIQFLYNKDWYQLFCSSDKDEAEQLADWEDFLSQYDMIVLGFTDVTCFTNDSVFVAGFKDYVAQGKSVILSHDIVSDSEFAYDSTKTTDVYTDYAPWLRTIAGQRRAYFNLTSDGTYEKSYNETWSENKLVSLIENYSGNASDKTYHTFSEEIDGDSVESNLLGTTASELRDNSTNLYVRTLQNIINNKVTQTGLKFDRSSSMISDLIKSKKGWDDGDNGSRDTTYVELTNSAQITSYPYKFDDVIEVAGTHAQNYQLDLESESDGDVNVWYNLTDRYSTNISATLKGKGYKNDTYSSRELDSRNNFYIYNKGNITYTGSGHGQDSEAEMTDDELKLFVNTMISAYRPSEEAPTIRVVNADTNSNDDIAYIYLDYDENAKQAVSAYVTQEDESSITEESGYMEVKIQIVKQALSADSKKTNYLFITKKENDSDRYVQSTYDFTDRDYGEVPAYTENTGREGYQVISVEESEMDNEDAAMYIIRIPYSEFSDDGSVTLQLNSYATFKNKGKVTRTESSTKYVRIMYMPLFDLN